MRLHRLGLLLVLVAVGGCEDSVDPTVGLDVPFSLYGQLDPTADHQAIRVAPIALSLDAPQDTIDATVTSTDLGTGATTAWRDSLVTFADGSRGHVFVADFTPRPGSTVRVDARRSDGAASSVTVEVPPLARPTVDEPIFLGNAVGYPVRIATVPNVLNGQFIATVAGHPDDLPGVVRRILIPVQAQPEETAPGVWEIDVPVVTALRRYLEQHGLFRTGLGIVTVEYNVFVTGPGWTPPSTDPDVLVEPGTFSNVESGLGYVGGGYRTSVEWILSPTVAFDAGFSPGDDPAGALTFNEILPGERGHAWVELYNPTLSSVSLDGYSLSNSESEPRLQRLRGEMVPARGFRVIPLSFGGGSSLFLFGPSGELILKQFPMFDLASNSGGEISYGSYPDGYSKIIRKTIGLSERIYDLFRGPLVPTPGRPNELGIDLAVLNEINTEGARGWVETLTLDPRADSLRVLFEEEQAGASRHSAGRVVPTADGFGVAEENGRGLTLPQAGAGLFLLSYYRETRFSGAPGFPPEVDPQLQFRVIDYYRYGGQTSGRTVGRLPDARGPWTPELRPTRGAPNASARLGL
ncbi:hypothetical protein [Rubrivirga sp. IMCC45206]|uniref:hypothetical protein n=1 Tax=Rubrivirga sp. IMCC45206 TaxID=3391614 RepID=UPI00398FB404